MASVTPGASTYGSIDGGNAKPSVLLIGWTGHLPKHLAKYGDVWAGLGFNPVQYNDHSNHFIGSSAAKEQTFATQVVELIRKEAPAVIQVFSNGGAWVWSDALRLASKEGGSASPFPSVQRVVIDSAPGQFYLSDLPSFFNFAWAMAGKNIVTKALLLLFWIPFVLIFMLYFLLTCKFMTKCNMTTRYWEGLIQGAKALKCPHLLLFSQDDGLIPVRHVRSFAEALKATGVEVQSKEWQKSEHVGHLRHHTEEYVGLLKDFGGPLLLGRAPTT